MKAWLHDQISAQSERWRLWAPVAMGLGCAGYFALKTEPGLWPLVLAAVVSLACAAMAWSRGTWRIIPFTLVAFAVTGLLVAKLRSDAVAAPIVEASQGPIGIEGWIVDVSSPGSRGARVVLAPTWMQGVAAERIPHRLNLTVRGEAPRPGTPVAVRAIVNPPPGPASPGAFDFGRNAWFQSIGGSALAITEPRSIMLNVSPWPLRLKMAVNGMRFDLGQRIVARLGPETGGIATAMVTGHEAWVDPADEQAMRDSGLAHILSISGLHMAIVGGFVFFAVRLGVAAWPWLVLRVPGKKVAAWAGIAAVAVYLVVSGAPPPAERAAIVAWVAFAAILLDRRAISMNALALAAVIVLLRRPESVVQPGFQMSFAATAALVALAEVWPTRLKEIDVPWPIATIQKVASWVFAALAASFVAGLATGPFAMQHFNRSAVYGLFANLAVAPISSFVMMPSLAVGAVMEAFGWGGPALWLAGESVGWMMQIGRFTADLPGAVATIPSAPAIALPVAFVGLLFVCLWQGRLRWLGLPLACAVLLWPRAPAPDVWINSQGTNLAIRVGDQAELVRPRVGLFAADIWSRRRGLVLSTEGNERSCRRSWCVLGVGDERWAVWFGRRAPNAEEMTALCEGAIGVVVRAEVAVLPESCRASLVLDGLDLARGSAELWREGVGWRGVRARDVQGERPWTAGGDRPAR
jgi:competence protein ComEC